MHGKHRCGLDYTPLSRFFLAKVGDEWNAVHSEPTSRLDNEEPIFWMVARAEAEKRPRVRICESSIYSGLYADDNGKLTKVAPELRNEDLTPDRPCCPQTFNGVPLIRKYEPSCSRLLSWPSWWGMAEGPKEECTAKPNSPD